VKFYLDEHIPKGVVEGLRRRGVDVLPVQEADRSGDSDEKQLAFATREGRTWLVKMNAQPCCVVINLTMKFQTLSR
jgi:hypothetical protein